MNKKKPKKPKYGLLLLVLSSLLQGCVASVGHYRNAGWGGKEFHLLKIEVQSPR